MIKLLVSLSLTHNYQYVRCETNIYKNELIVYYNGKILFDKEMEGQTVASQPRDKLVLYFLLKLFVEKYIHTCIRTLTESSKATVSFFWHLL